VIVATRDLALFRGEVTMVDGSFDPLHEGHIEYFRLASELGRPVLCNIAPDTWTATKHRILLAQNQRATIIDAIRYISYVHVAESPTAEILRSLVPAAYAKGRDWLDRGGVPALESELCQTLGIQVVYLDSVENSSSEILRRFDSGETKK
jgi:cytidyltransferase-like protein